jgi:hypothetical protein
MIACFDLPMLGLYPAFLTIRIVNTPVDTTLAVFRAVGAS